jgi:hypothetical protein
MEENNPELAKAIENKIKNANYELSYYRENEYHLVPSKKSKEFYKRHWCGEYRLIVVLVPHWINDNR